MDKLTRARLIVDHVLGLHGQFSKPGLPRSEFTTLPSQWISDDPRWQARVSPQYHRTPEGDWDLFELFVYDKLRMTAALKGDALELRLFTPGSWEPIFTLHETPDTEPLLP